VTVHVAKAEMGQGIGTALAQIVADEVEVDWKDVRVHYPVNDPKYGSSCSEWTGVRRSASS
jgi:isoquinoline 1-oxidoreductase subunit beta